MAEPALRPTTIDPREFLAAVPHPVQIADAMVLVDLMEATTGQPARMWGPTIVGFGLYHYVYASGHEGYAPAVGFSPRRAHLAFYGLTYTTESELLLGDLGKYKRGAGCLYVNKLADIDTTVLRRLVQDGYTHATTVLHESPT